jgi:hypothetical protein
MGTRAPLTVTAIAFIVYASASWRAAAVLPGGDEPHYLVITQSLLADGDLRIENNHARGDYRPYFRGVLRPDYLKRGQDREIYSIHLPGVSVFVAPAFAVGGYAAVRLWLALFAALGAGLTWRMARDVTASAPAAWFATAGAAFTVPFLFLAFTVYPDGVGATVVAAAFAMIVAHQAERVRPLRWWAAAGTLAAVLPWLHARFAVIAAALGAVFVLRAVQSQGRWRALAAFSVVPVASAIAWFGYYWIIYGQPNPSAAYGHYTQMAVSNAARGLPGLLFDQQFGLLTPAPVYALALTGLFALFRQQRRLCLEALLIVVPYSVVTAMYAMWWGGTSSPARFLGPVMLLAAVPMAVAWREAAGAASRTVQAIVLGVSLALVAVFLAVEHGRFAFSFRDGFAQWAVWASTLADVPRALPSWFRGGWQGGAPSAAVWLAALMLACAAARRISSRWARSPGAAALLSGACLGAAATGAASIAWRVEGASGIAPTNGQLAFIRALAADRASVTVSYDPLRVGDGRRLARTVRLGGDRRGGAPADAWLWLPNVPAGHYQLWLDNRRSGASFDIEVAVGRSGGTLVTWPIRDAKPGLQALDLHLPVDVHSVVVRGGREEREAVRGLWLQPLAIAGPGERMTEARALAARRYTNGTIAWAVGDTSYLEEGGLWVAGETDAQFVLGGPGDRGGRVIGLRSGAVATTADVTSGAFSVSVALSAGERREVTLPMSPDRPVLVHVRTSSGFVPSELDPASTDGRYLGVWIDFP